MKKVIILIFSSIISVIFTSCNQADELSSFIIKNEQLHLNNYNTISRMTNDPRVIDYIDSLKQSYKEETFKSLGYLEEKEHNGYNFTKSKILLKTYIDSCK